MIGKVLVCPICNTTEFEVKSKSGNIMLHCEDCGGKITVKDAGLVDGQIANFNLEQIILQEPREVKDDKAISDFCRLSLQMTKKQRTVVRAAFLACKEIRGIEGRAYQGTSIFWICVDFLSGIDYDDLSEKGRKAYDEAMKVQDDDDTCPVSGKSGLESESLFTE